MSTPLVFISHCTQDPRDPDLAHKIAESIRDRGGNAWIAPDSIPKGFKWNSAIASAIKQCSHFIVIITAASAKSQGVLEEIRLINARYSADPSVKVLPIPITDVGAFAGRDFLLSFQMITYTNDFRALVDELSHAIGLGAYSVPSFKALIREKTQGFVGRQYVFTEIDDFLQRTSNGYIVIEGDPGIGKTSILAEYCRREGSVAFFNIASEAINNAGDFLDTLSSQLVARYKFSHRSLSTDWKGYGSFLRRLLEDTSDSLNGYRTVIVVDALDEVDRTGLPESTNTLYLPVFLPQGVYFLCSVRSRDPYYRLRTQAPYLPIDLMAASHSAANSRDAAEYVRRSVASANLSNWIKAQGRSVQDFVAELTERSENNFMYLHYLVSHITQGRFDDLNLHNLPLGLKNYYEDHWVRMGMTIKPLPKAKLKLLYILSEVRRPISGQLLAFLAAEDRLTVSSVIEEWGPFLHTYMHEGEVRYAIYHESFREFLRRKDIIGAAGMTLKQIHSDIANRLKSAL